VSKASPERTQNVGLITLGLLRLDSAIKTLVVSIAHLSSTLPLGLVPITIHIRSQQGSGAPSVTRAARADTEVSLLSHILTIPHTHVA